MADSELSALQAELGRRPPPAILDARTATDFAAVHLRGAVSLPGVAAAAADPVAFDAILPSIFLPPRHRPLLVMADRLAMGNSLEVRSTDVIIQRGTGEGWATDADT